MATFNSTSWNTTINTLKKKKRKQGSNYGQRLRTETKLTYIACIAGKAEAFFFLKLLHRLHIILKKKYAGLYKI